MYVKIFGSILDSSIWAEDPATCKVWITMLAMADETGFVRSSRSGLARRAVVTNDACQIALAVLENPDEDDSSGEHDGRRAEKVTGGWLVLNYQKYRELQTRQQAKNAERQKRFREKQRPDTGDGGDVTSVTDNGRNARSASASASKGVRESERKGDPILEHLPEPYRDSYLGYCRAARNPEALRATIQGLHDGLQGTAYSWDIIGQAIHEMAVAGAKGTASSLRGFCRRLHENPAGKPPARSFADVEVPQ